MVSPSFYQTVLYTQNSNICIMTFVFCIRYAHFVFHFQCYFGQQGTTKKKNLRFVLWFGWFIFGFSTLHKHANTRLFGLLFWCLSYGIPFGFFSSSLFFRFLCCCFLFGCCCCCSSSSHSTCIMRETRAHNHGVLPHEQHKKNGATECNRFNDVAVDSCCYFIYS